MNWLQPFGVWWLGWSSHLPFVGRYIGEGNLAILILIATLLAGTFMWFKSRWGDQVAIPEGAGAYTKLVGKTKNFRARVFGYGSLAAAVLILGSAFATGTLGVGSELDLGKNPTVLASNNYRPAWLDPGSRDGVEGWHTVMHQPLGRTGWDKQHPFAVFIPKSLCVEGFTPAEGVVLSLSLFQNRYSVAPEIKGADPNMTKTFVGN